MENSTGRFWFALLCSQTISWFSCF